MTSYVLSHLWGATHVLSFEREGKMVEELVRLSGSSLFTVEEWTGHTPADWTLGKGRLCFQGRRFEGQARLRPVPPAVLSLDEVLGAIVRLGKADVGEVSRLLGRPETEVRGKIKALRMLQLAEEPKLDGVGASAVH